MTEYLLDTPDNPSENLGSDTIQKAKHKEDLFDEWYDKYFCDMQGEDSPYSYNDVKIRCLLERLLRCLNESNFVDYQMEKFGERFKK